MNSAQKKFIKGIFLSFIFVFLFLFFVFESNIYLSPILASQKNIYLSSTLNSLENDKVSSSNENNNIQQQEEQDNQTVNIEEIRLLQIGVTAKAAISIESNLGGTQKTIFERNKDLKLPIASLTKLMTALVAFDNYGLSREILITEDILPKQSYPIQFEVGQTFSVDELLNIMLVESNNKAAYILSSYMGNERFIYLMNKKAEKIGLKNTSFSDTTGLNQDNVSTIEDLAKLAEYIIKNYPQIAEITISKEYNHKNFDPVINTNELLADFPNTVLSKTGFTNEANGCLLMVVKNSNNDNYSINIVLGADDRFLEMKKIINRNI